MSKGKRANKWGQALENNVVALLDDEYTKVTPQRFFALRDLKQPIYAQQCIVGKNIYAKDRKVDFILYHPTRWKKCLVLQCKWQSSGGSADEKYPFEVLSIQMNEFETIIVLDGGGYAKGAELWLKGQVGKKKLLHVLSLGEIRRFQSQGRI